MTSKQNKPQGLTVSTHRQSALSSGMSPLDSILPMKKRTLRTHTLSDVTPHSPQDSKNGVQKGNDLQKHRPNGNDDNKSNKPRSNGKKKTKKKAKDSSSIDASDTFSEDHSQRNSTSKKKDGDVFQKYYTHSETWKIVTDDKAAFPRRDEPPSENIFTMVKNSKQDPSEKIDKKLYSSLKYVLLHKVNAPYFSDENGDLGFILCRVQVVCPDTGEEIKRDGEGILTGNIESSLRMDAVTHMKIQFTSCSSHHDKKQFAFRLLYYLNSNLKQPILVKQSTPFLVYARKKTGAKRKKRSKSSKDSKTISEPKQKRARKLPPADQQPVEIQYPDKSAAFNNLATEIDRIKKEFMDKIPDNERSQAKAIVAEKLSIQQKVSHNHLSSVMSGHHHSSIHTINTPATPSGLFASSSGTLLTPLQTPNPDAPNGSGVPQPLSLMHNHDDHHGQHHHTGDTDDHHTQHHHHTGDDDHEEHDMALRLETPTEMHLDQHGNYM